jgi:surface antigen
MFFLSSNFNDFEITKWANGPDWALRARRPGHGCYKVTKVARKANPMN